MRVCCLYALSHCSMPNYLCSFTSNCKKVQTLQSTMLSQIPLACDYEDYQHFKLVYTTQVNRTFRARWLVGSEVISQVLFTSKQPKKNKMAFIDTLSQIQSLFGPLVIQLVWYILKQLFTSIVGESGDFFLVKDTIEKVRQIPRSIALESPIRKESYRIPFSPALPKVLEMFDGAENLRDHRMKPPVWLTD